MLYIDFILFFILDGHMVYSYGNYFH